MISEQVASSAVAQLIIFKKNMKPVEILTRLRAQYSDETLPMTQMHDWSN
jgi:hypothetical protein